MGAFQKSDASGQKRGGFETLLEGSPMCVAQLTECGHSCPLPPKCCFTASNILQEWQSDTVFFRASWERRRPRRLFGPREAGEDASVPRGAVRDLIIFFNAIHLRETSEAEDSLWGGRGQGCPRPFIWVACPETYPPPFSLG